MGKRNWDSVLNTDGESQEAKELMRQANRKEDIESGYRAERASMAGTDNGIHRGSPGPMAQSGQRSNVYGPARVGHGSGAPVNGEGHTGDPSAISHMVDDGYATKHMVRKSSIYPHTPSSNQSDGAVSPGWKRPIPPRGNTKAVRGQHE